MKSTITDKLVSTSTEPMETAISSIEVLVNPNTPVLTPEERRNYGRGGGDSNKLLIDDVFMLKDAQPQLKSDLIDWDEFTSDYNAGKKIESWLNRLYAIIYKLESAKMLHDYDNYNDAIDQYAHLSYLKRNNVQGAPEAYRTMKSHFKKAKKEPNPEE